MEGANARFDMDMFVTFPLWWAAAKREILDWPNR
jgi:hypothetical protein